MPWLTPDSIPEDDDCRPLSIPADSAWLALVSGALTELTLPYNWQKFGTLTVAETVARMQEIVDNYYNSPCAMCLTPGDYRVTRISPSGHLQQLDPSGDWTDATGDYVIPPPSARTEGTEPDQNCLAAKNATNVLSQLYESVSESFSSELSTDEAITAFIAAAVAAIGFEFAPITWSLAAIGFVAFEALFQALQYVTADLWTEDFSKQFECLLLNCAVNTAGVVTFDWDCFNSALLAQVNDMGLSEVQMRLYVQIGYLLYFIGGADGLNLAGRTTDITNDDCSFCTEWCVAYDLTDNDGGFVLAFSEARGEWVSGTGWVAVPFDIYMLLQLTRDWPSGTLIDAIHFHYTVDVASGGGYSFTWNGTTEFSADADGTFDQGITLPGDDGGLFVNFNMSTDNSHTGSATLFLVTVQGHGTKPDDGTVCP